MHPGGHGKERSLFQMSGLCKLWGNFWPSLSVGHLAEVFVGRGTEVGCCTGTAPAGVCGAAGGLGGLPLTLWRLGAVSRRSPPARRSTCSCGFCGTCDPATRCPCPSPYCSIWSPVGEGTEVCVNSRSSAHQWSQRGALEVNELWGPSVLLCKCFLEAEAGP